MRERKVIKSSNFDYAAWLESLCQAESQDGICMCGLDKDHDGKHRCIAVSCTDPEF